MDRDLGQSKSGKLGVGDFNPLAMAEQKALGQ